MLLLTSRERERERERERKKNKSETFFLPLQKKIFISPEIKIQFFSSRQLSVKIPCARHGKRRQIYLFYIVKNSSDNWKKKKKEKEKKEGDWEFEFSVNVGAVVASQVVAKNVTQGQSKDERFVSSKKKLFTFLFFPKKEQVKKKKSFPFAADTKKRKKK